MMNQEEYMDVASLKRQGWTNKQIADHLGRHPATIGRWLKAGGPPPKREFTAKATVDEHWGGRIDALLDKKPDLLGTSVERIIRAEGFEGSYQSITAYLRSVRGPKRKRGASACVPIETAPGAEGQFDWSDCCDYGEAWGLGPLHCFGAILCWSRYRFWWFANSIDRHHTFEGLIRFFDDVGGVPADMRHDRMGALGQSRGRRFAYHPPALEFARHYGFAFRACKPGDARRKGKVERPFLELDTAFMAECDLDPPASVGELNARVTCWLGANVHTRPHRSTGIPPADRLSTEAALLLPNPTVGFDASYKETRKVGAVVPLVEWRSVAYSVPPELLGTLVEVRQPIGASGLEIRARGRLVATHRLAPPGSEPVWDPSHRLATEKIALSRHDATRPALRAISIGRREVPMPVGDFDVAEPDLRRYGSAIVAASDESATGGALVGSREAGGK